MSRIRRKSTFGMEISDLERKRSSLVTSLVGSVKSGIHGTDEDPSITIQSKFGKSSGKKSMLQMSLLGINNDMSGLTFDSDEEASVESEISEDEKKTESLKESQMSSPQCINESDDKEEDDTFDAPFESKFAPGQMRCLALVAHNHMKPAMKQFVLANKNLLRHFRLTGTNTTMTMLREVFGDDPSIEFGPTCTSGPLGGDAELVAVMCTENLGGCVFFQDPMSAHPHTADIECLNRQANVHNVIMMPNPATAFAVLTTFRIALKEGRPELIPSFFQTLESPSVAEYKVRQAKVVENNKS